MSKSLKNNRKNADSHNKENINYPNNNYSNVKSLQNIKINKQILNKTSLPFNSNINNQIIDNNNIFTTKEIPINNHRNNNSLNKSINHKDNKYITMNDIIGEKPNLNLDLLNIFYNNYEQSKTSKKKNGIVKSYGVNTYQGIVRNYNEDRVSIIINMSKPSNYHKKSWPKISFFGIYDGHGGEGCAEYLKDNLHKLICINNEFFPDNVPEAIKVGFQKAEKNFINHYSLNNKNQIKDKSGSCAIIMLVIDTMIYVANVGDSRCILSMEKGKKYIDVTQDHKPNSPKEMKRIQKYGGDIYQSETLVKNSNNPKINGKILIGPYRVVPGRLSVSRTIGDVEAKLQQFGGNPNVIIAEPDIFIYDSNKNDIDFFILGCDGIYDQITSNEVLDLAWMIIKKKEKDNPIVRQIKDIHNQSGVIVDFIIKSALARKSFDNVTCLFVALKELGEFDNDNSKKNYNDNKNNIINISTNAPLSMSIDMKDKNKKNIFEKMNGEERKSDANIKNIKYNSIKNNRNNNNFYFSSYITSNENKKFSDNTIDDYKYRNARLNTISNDNNSNYSLQIDKNEKKNNNIMTINNNYINDKDSYSRINNNIQNDDYIENAQSFTKINSHSTDKNSIRNNNYRNLKKSNMDTYNNNNTYISPDINKRFLEKNTINKKSSSMEKINHHHQSYINTNTNNNNNNISNSNENKPLSRYNYYHERNNYKIIRNNISSINNNKSNSIYLNTTYNNYGINNHAYTTSHRYVVSNQSRNNNNYTSIRKNLINFNQIYKNPNQISHYYNNINNNNNSTNNINTYSSLLIRNQRKNNSLKNNSNNNSTLIIDKKNNYIQRNRISGNSIKEESFSIQNLNKNKINGNLYKNINFYNINNINNYQEQNRRSQLYKEVSKNYQNNTYNSTKNIGNKYNNYLITEINHTKNNGKQLRKKEDNVNGNDYNNKIDRHYRNRGTSNHHEYVSVKDNNKEQNKNIIKHGFHRKDIID